MDVDCKACLALEVGLDLDLVRLAVACSHWAAPSFMMIGKICNSMLICVIRHETESTRVEGLVSRCRVGSRQMHAWKRALIGMSCVPRHGGAQLIAGITDF